MISLICGRFSCASEVISLICGSFLRDGQSRGCDSCPLDSDLLKRPATYNANRFSQGSNLPHISKMGTKKHGLQRGHAGEMAVELRVDRFAEFECGNDHWRLAAIRTAVH